MGFLPSLLTGATSVELGLEEEGGWGTFAFYYTYLNIILIFIVSMYYFYN